MQTYPTTQMLNSTLSIGLGCQRWEEPNQWLWHPLRDEGRENGNKSMDERGWNEQWSQVLVRT
jgi:hypothetical protein